MPSIEGHLHAMPAAFGRRAGHREPAARDQGGHPAQDRSESARAQRALLDLGFIWETRDSGPQLGTPASPDYLRERTPVTWPTVVPSSDPWSPGFPADPAPKWSSKKSVTRR